MINAAFPGFIVRFLVVDVSAKQPARLIFWRGAYAYLARFAGSASLSAFASHEDVVACYRLTHGSHLRYDVALRSTEADRGLRLPESLVDLEPRMFFPAVEDLRVKRLSRRATMHERGEIVLGKIELHHHAVHRGRNAEGRNAEVL